jgi:hypothetical protein
MVERPDGGMEPSSEGQIPTELVEHPGSRYVWFGGFAALGIALVAFGVDSLGSAEDGWVPLMLFGFGVASLAIGAIALRWGIVADRDAVTITNTRHHTIPWAELEDVVLVRVESAIDLGFHYMVFLTREGRAVRPAAPTGLNRPGRKLPRLQHDLLAMRDRYTRPAA